MKKESDGLTELFEHLICYNDSKKSTDMRMFQALVFHNLKQKDTCRTN